MIPIIEILNLKKRFNGNLVLDIPQLKFASEKMLVGSAVVGERANPYSALTLDDTPMGTRDWLHSILLSRLSSNNERCC